jgi:nitroreductase
MISAEDLLACMRQRRSIRRFRPEPPPGRVIAQVLEAARWAPSNHNRQAFRILVLEDPAEIAALAARVRAGLDEKLRALPASLAAMGRLADEAAWFAAAPVLLLVLHKRPPRVAERLLDGVPNPNLVSGEPLSAAMAVQNLLLMTGTLGLGACVLTAPLVVPEAMAAVPGLPPGYDATCLVALGYPAEAPAAPPRKPLDQLVDFRREP